MLKVRYCNLYIGYNMVKILVQMAKLSTLQSSDIVGFLFSHEKKSFHGFLLIEVVIRMVTLD